MRFAPMLLANFAEPRGGGEVGLVMLAEELTARGHAPLVAVPGPGSLAAHLDRVVLPPDTVAAGRRLAAEAHRFDLIHATSGPGVDVATAAGTNRPVLWHALLPNRCHGDARRAARCALVLCNSQATAARFAGLAEPRVVPNGVAPPVPGRSALPVRPGQHTIVIAGPVCPRKGQLDALPALDEVLAARDDVDVLLVGRGRDPRIDRAVRSWAPRLRHVDHVAHLGDALGEAALVVVPSRSEGFGRVAVEATAAGTPVLARPVEGLRETLAPLADPWLPPDRHAWAQRILAELRRPTHTPAELRACAARFAPSTFVDGVVDAYTALLAKTVP